MDKHYFGTDGMRGPVGKGFITPEFFLKLGWAVGKVFAKTGSSTLLLGKDTRISGYMLESALVSGLLAAGVDVQMLGPMPTPAVAYLTRALRAQAGIVISASHNPYHDNGIKLFSADGIKLADEWERAIEQQLDQTMTTVDSAQLGKVTRNVDAQGRYIEFCKRAVPLNFSLKGLKIVVDCAHGAMYHVAPVVLAEFDATVTTMGVQPDGLNINHQCGSTQPQRLQQMVVAQGADIGIAFDGDGDRVILVNAQGEVVNGDQILFILAQDQQCRTGTCQGVVGTLMSNGGLASALAQHNIPFVRACVGDRYVGELLREHDWLLGGENSGHIICRDINTTGDGLVAALSVLFVMIDRGMSLQQLAAGMSLLPQVLINVPLQEAVQWENHTTVKRAVADAEEALQGCGRVLLRPSGTEAVVRVMVEGEDSARVTQLANGIAAAVQQVTDGSER